MSIQVTANTLYRELTKNLTKNNTKFIIDDFFRLSQVSLKIEKIKSEDNLYLINEIDLNSVDTNDLSLTERNLNEIRLGYDDIYFEPTLSIAEFIFKKYCELLEKLNQGKFKVILSISNTDSKNIVVRFYKVRENEAPVFNDNIEECKWNGLLVGEVNFPS